MDHGISRRAFTFSLPLGIGGLAVHAQGRGAEVTREQGAGAAVPEWFPRHDPEVVQEVVGLSHRDLEGVRALVDARPVLANAAIDWGFGDWETALGAASHTGQREIAEYLISKGARPDLFTYAMLGDLATVRALCEAYPEQRRITGPHGITLLAHARAGGERAKAVVDYLLSLGDADPKVVEDPLPEAERKGILGSYRFGAGERDVLEVGEGMGGLTIKRKGGSARRLFRMADGSFHPAGAPRVRVVFEVGGGAGGPVARVSVTDHDLHMQGVR